jgi:type VI secretion system protein ImpM
MTASGQFVPGVYGKLPAHGDFIQRNLPQGFVREWDVWLQHFVSGTKEKMGGDWLDLYLTSPIWRFALSSGVLEAGRWAGIMLPSVDQVGRYFPFTIAVRLPDTHNPLEFMALQGAWFGAVEALSLRALDSDIALDDLVEELAALDLKPASVYGMAEALKESKAMQMDMEFEEQSAGSVYSGFLDAALARLFSSYSVWSTAGSDRVASCVFTAQGLPASGKMAAMLDGQWQHWGWTQPYKLQSEVDPANRESFDVGAEG